MHSRVCRASLLLTLLSACAQGGGARQARECAATVFSALQQVDYSVRQRLQILTERLWQHGRARRACLLSACQWSMGLSAARLVSHHAAHVSKACVLRIAPTW